MTGRQAGMTLGGSGSASPRGHRLADLEGFRDLLVGHTQEVELGDLGGDSLV